MAVTETLSQEETEQTPTCPQVVRELAIDLQLALARKGRAPFVLSGLPMFEDLCALRQTLDKCLTLREDIHLRHWYTVLHDTLPSFQLAFEEVTQAHGWVDGIKKALDVPPPTAAEPGLGGDAVARQLAHCLGTLTDLPALSPWLTQFRKDLLAVSERYWSGLFHCYNIVGLPATNNDHESLYGQIKRRLRRQLGVSQLRESLLRRGAWSVVQIDVASPDDLRDRLAQVSWEDYSAERVRYERRQAQFRRRYRWYHQRDDVLQKQFSAWVEAVSNC